MSDEEHKDHKAADGKTVPTLSVGSLWQAIKKLELHERCFCWGAVVYALATLLPWSESAGLASANAWNLNALLTLANLAVLVALVLQLAALAGFGDRSMKSWLKLYRYAMPIAFCICLFTGIVTSDRALGMVIGIVALCIHGYGLYAMLDKRNILPLRITK